MRNLTVDECVERKIDLNDPDLPPKRLTYEKFFYRRDLVKWSVKLNMPVCYYVCSHIDRDNCPGRLTANMSQYKGQSAYSIKVGKKEHTCKLNGNVGIKMDMEKDVNELINERALKEAGKSCRELALKIFEDVLEKYDEVAVGSMPNATEIARKIQQTRSEHRNGNWDGLICTEPMCNVSEDDNRKFLQFCSTVNVNGELVKIIGWAHPQLIDLMRCSELKIFIDCTFKVVPTGFYQVMIIMVYSEQFGIYVPVWYVLLPSKSREVYKALGYIKLATPLKMKIKSAVCDFETSLMDAIKFAFGLLFLIGCYFHWLQCQLRKMKELGISKEVRHDMMSLVGLLTEVTDKDLENNNGVHYIQTVKTRTLWNSKISTGIMSINMDQW